MGDTTGDENIGYYFYGIFFAISVLLNISYFFVNTKSEQKKCDRREKRTKNYMKNYT